MKELLEKDIEAYLVKRVKALGGEIRKVKWPGRNSAPDRVVMLPTRSAKQVAAFEHFGLPTGVIPSSRTIWVELKRPGGKAKFPSDARERAQDREHKRMRAVGQRVEVIDSFEGVDEVLK